MKTIKYSIEVFLNGIWQPSVTTDRKQWKRQLKNHRQLYGEPARAVKSTKILEVLG